MRKVSKSGILAIEENTDERLGSLAARAVEDELEVAGHRRTVGLVVLRQFLRSLREVPEMVQVGNHQQCHQAMVVSEAQVRT